MNQPLILAPRTLLVLCGPAGCGKSTFAARHFPETNAVSSDRCRGMVCDDESSQAVNREAFDLFHYILRKRMQLGRFCVADSVALLPYARQRLRQLSQQFDYASCLVIFDIPFEISLQRDSQRPRQVGESVVRYHYGQLAKVLQDAPQEGWDLLRVIHEDVGDLEARIEG